MAAAASYLLKGCGLLKKRNSQFFQEADIGDTGYSCIPRIMTDSITIFVRVLAIQSVPVFIELLAGGRMTLAGCVTEAWSAFLPLARWNAWNKSVGQSVGCCTCNAWLSGRVRHWVAT